MIASSSPHKKSNKKAIKNKHKMKFCKDCGDKSDGGEEGEEGEEEEGSVKPLCADKDTNKVV